MRISKEYAAALFALATEEKQEAEYNEALKLVLEVFSQNPEYIKVLSSPSISKDERQSLIDDAFGDVLPKHILSFLKILCKKSHIDLIYECITEYKSIFDEKFGVAEVNMFTATLLSEDKKVALKESLENTLGHKVKLRCSINTEIIGGIIVEVNGKIIDASLSHELKELKEVIIK